MNKQEGERLAALSFTEKIQLLEKLRDRTLAFIEAREKLAKEKSAKGPRANQETINKDDGTLP